MTTPVNFEPHEIFPASYLMTLEDFGVPWTRKSFADLYEKTMAIYDKHSKEIRKMEREDLEKALVADFPLGIEATRMEAKALLPVFGFAETARRLDITVPMLARAMSNNIVRPYWLWDESKWEAVENLVESDVWITKGRPFLTKMLKRIDPELTEHNVIGFAEMYNRPFGKKANR